MSKLQDKDEYNKLFETCKVFPIVSDYKTRGYQIGGGKNKLGNEVYPICLKDIDDLKNGAYGQFNYSIGKYSEGTLLMRHPYRPYELIPSDTSEIQIIQDHLYDLGLIFKALGASNIEQHVEIEDVQQKKINCFGKIRWKSVSAEGDAKIKSENEKYAKIALIISPNPDDSHGYDCAYKVARERNLLEVPVIKDILYNAKLGKDKKYVLDEELSEKIHQTIDVTLKVQDAQLFEIDARFFQDIDCKRKLRIKKVITW